MKDCAEKCKLTSYIHFAEPLQFDCNVQEERIQQWYAIDYGQKQVIDGIRLAGENQIEFKAILEKESNE